MFAIEIHMHSLSSFKLTLHVQLKKIIFFKIIDKKTILWSKEKDYIVVKIKRQHYGQKKKRTQWSKEKDNIMVRKKTTLWSKVLTIVLSSSFDPSLVFLF
jgi:hypothetical protein